MLIVYTTIKISFQPRQNDNVTIQELIWKNDSSSIKECLLTSITLQNMMGLFDHDSLIMITNKCIESKITNFQIRL